MRTGCSSATWAALCLANPPHRASRSARVQDPTRKERQVSNRAEALSDHEIARRATRGAASYVFRTFGAQVVQAVSALAVARILDPRDYGVFALALTLVGAVRMFGDLGITYSLSVKPKISDTDLRVGVSV